jgi:hypothetical protein
LEATVEMRKIELEVGEYINSTKIGAEDPVALKVALKHQAEAVHDSALTMLLISISIIEVFCYVIFFFMRRQATHGFKKVD